MSPGDEADAFARWAAKRLPSEQEWEAACAGASAERANLDQLGFGTAPPAPMPTAAASGAVQMLGDVWEWTCLGLPRLPGFEPFPYPEYSEVFFGDAHKVLRGGSWATRRNVDPPQLPQLGPAATPPDLRRLSLRAGPGLIRAETERARTETTDLSSETTADQIAIEVHLAADGGAAMERDIRAGLTSEPKELAPKYFYDERGSQLFEQITELARVLPDPRRARRSSPSAPPRSSPPPASRACWSSWARARRRRPATC